MVHRLVFMGSDPIALPLLEALVSRTSGPEIVAVYTQPDRATGRGQRVQANPIKRWAEGRGIPVRQPDRLTEDERGHLVDLRPDLVLVMAYGHLLRQSWMDTPPLGIYNLHTSLLPQYRGASPIQATLVDGNETGGVTLMQIVAELDAGPLVDREIVGIDSLETAGSLEVKLAAACVPLVLRNIGSIEDRTVKLIPQDEGRVSFTRRLRKADGVLDFSRSSLELARRVNGLFPWPGVMIRIGDTAVRCGLADVLPGRSVEAPGTIVASESEGLCVATGVGILRFLKLQRPGGRMLAASDFLRGFPVPVGTVLPSQPMPELIRRA